MVQIYGDAEYLAAYKQKQRLWWIFVAVSAAYLSAGGGFLLWGASLPYGDPLLIAPKICAYALSALYVIFAFIYLGIPYGRARRYYRMLTQFSTCLKMEEKNYFYNFQEKTLQQDNIDVLSCLFEIWDKKKKEWQEREVYYDVEQPALPFEEGDFIRYVTQGNFLIEYEILEKNVLAFEEVEDDESEE